MKKWIAAGLLIVVLVVGMFGCSMDAQVKSNGDVADYMNLEYVCSSDGKYVYYDKNTKVMYYESIDMNRGFMTVIYNANGTVKLYEGE